MKLAGIPFQTIDWDAVEPTRHAGETGFATWRTLEVGNVRVRIVEYSAGYLADHWCERGHVVHALDGELVSELRDGRSFVNERAPVTELGDELAVQGMDDVAAFAPVV